MKPVALITGGQQGIGLGIAAALSGAGFALALASRSAEDEPAVVEALEAWGTTHATFSTICRTSAGVPSLLDRVEAALGPVTRSSETPGVPAKVRGDMLDLALDNFDFVLGVNLRGTYFLAQEAARRMLARRPTLSVDRVRHLGQCRDGLDRARRILHLQGGRSDDGRALRGEAGAARNRRLRDPPRDHRDRHDRRREGQIHHPHRGRPRPGGALGPARGHRRVIVPLVRGDLAFATAR